MFKTSLALLLKSLRLPIGVATIYNPLIKFFIYPIFIFIVACAPVNNINVNDDKEKNYSLGEVAQSTEQTTDSEILYEEPNTEKIKKNTLGINISNEIEIILPTYTSENIINQLINSFELILS